jgi:hypothetical protein
MLPLVMLDSSSTGTREQGVLDKCRAYDPLRTGGEPRGRVAAERRKLTAIMAADSLAMAEGLMTFYRTWLGALSESEISDNGRDVNLIPNGTNMSVASERVTVRFESSVPQRAIQWRHHD